MTSNGELFDSSIEAAAYYKALRNYYFSDKNQRLGQWLCNWFNFRAEQVPGLWEADGMDAERIFFTYYNLH